ncbi:hypothetical protein NBE98_17360 [Clostridium swellfunianum]|uniref:CBO0543 family protein n=1 Tax=Clostridium swellfunianum TaxID=1367462 RepID=UPI00202F59B2|nr:CBO0543 family protein [Clostridium swellfunianum]MCM0650139.1 hypothetical protein [Clostridium swellfunianum]
MHLREKFIISSVWVITLISTFFIPKQKYREAYFIFMFSQLPSWIFGLVVVEAGLIAYPVRELSRANATSFSFEFLVLPFMCIFFNLYYPVNKNLFRKLSYYITILGPFTLAEYFTEKYTDIIEYLHWAWYTTFITMILFIYFVRAAYKWYFRLDKPFHIS